MSGRDFQIVWSKRALKSLEEIFEYYSRLSKKSAIRLKNNILKRVEEIKYLKQYQVDEYSANHRRIIVSHYKVVYSFKENEIRILAIFDSRQDPGKLDL